MPCVRSSTTSAWGSKVSSGVGQIDIFATIPSQDGIKCWLAGFAAPIQGYLKDPRLTAPDYDVKDFTAAALQGTTYRGTMFALPSTVPRSACCFYRKDLFQKHEVKVPTRMLAEVEEAAKRLTLKGADGKIEVYGVANRGRREAVGGGTASAWLHNFGGEWLDKSGNPAVNSPEAVQAWEMYSRILRLYGPPGQTNFQWYEAASMFAQGRVAMMMDQNVIGVPMFSDPEKSRIVGQVGYAKFPAGPVRDTPNLLTPGLCLTSSSKNREAAWLPAEWLTNKRQQLRAQMLGASMTRKSAWESPEFKAGDKLPSGRRSRSSPCTGLRRVAPADRRGPRGQGCRGHPPGGKRRGRREGRGREGGGGHQAAHGADGEEAVAARRISAPVGPCGPGAAVGEGPPAPGTFRSRGRSRRPPSSRSSPSSSSRPPTTPTSGLFAWYISKRRRGSASGTTPRCSCATSASGGRWRAPPTCPCRPIPIQVVLGTAIAVLLRQRIPVGALLRVRFMLPMVATPVAMALVWGRLHPDRGAGQRDPREWVWVSRSCGPPPGQRCHRSHR